MYDRVVRIMEESGGIVPSVRLDATIFCNKVFYRGWLS
jgi:hypothetical protein